MSELNEEWAQSIIKLGLIEAKKSALVSIGDTAYQQFTYGREELTDFAALLREYAEIDALLRDDKATSKMAAEVVKASRK
jgi:hypothetical protein